MSEPSSTSMKQAMQRAGVNVAQSMLALMAIDALRKAGKSPAVAIDSFVDRVSAGAGPALELLGITRAQVLPVAMRYLQARAADMAGKPAIGGASHTRDASQSPADRPSDEQRDDDRASHQEGASQAGPDRPVVTETDRPSQISNASQATADRPVRKKGKAAPSKIGATAALAVASQGIFAKRIGYDLTIGMATYHDCRTLTIKGNVIERFGSRLMTDLAWSDDPEIREKQRVADVAQEAQVQALYDDAYRALDKLGITNAAA